MIIVPTYSQIILPNSRIYFQTENFMNLANEKPQEDEDILFLILKENTDKEELFTEDFYPIGVEGKIVEVNNNGYLIIDTLDRINIKNVTTDEHIEVTYTERYDINDIEEEIKEEKLKKLKHAIFEYISKFRWGLLGRSFLDSAKSIDDLACSMGYWLNTDALTRYKMIETDSIKERYELIEKEIYEYLEISKVSDEAETEIEQNNKRYYREQALKKQIEYLQDELDRLNPDSSNEISVLEKKVKEAGLNEEAKKEATRVLQRLKKEGTSSPEYGMLSGYLEFMTSLVWKKPRFKTIDINKAKEALDQHHYGLKKVKNRILEQIAVINLNKKQSGSILLFVGAPGTGKTSIGKSIAKALNREYVRVSLGGVRDEADIRGHRRTYIGAMAGRILNALSKSHSNNPVMVLDEVDKLASSYNGDPSSALLEVLDPEQNMNFTDHYLNVPYDLSDVFFICTANTIDTIPEPLLNRMEVIPFDGYTFEEKLIIAKKHLIPDSKKRNGLPEFKLNDSLIKSLIDNYTMESGLRSLKKIIDKLGRYQAVQLVSKGKMKRINTKQLPDILDRQPITHESILKEKKPGVVTGLAWTNAGGDILFIETMKVKGKGNLIITGQLGDVMKESASIALTLVKSLFPEEAQALENYDIHIHVPEGAIKKDGPSAGITLSTALASLLLNKEVSPEIAMTGEISLRGAVLPIGGLNEKLMAAVRSGIKKVLIPKENEKNLKDIPQEILKQLTIIPVSHIQEVLKETNLI